MLHFIWFSFTYHIRIEGVKDKEKPKKTNTGGLITMCVTFTGDVTMHDEINAANQSWNTWHIVGIVVIIGTVGPLWIYKSL